MKKVLSSILGIIIILNVGATFAFAYDDTGSVRTGSPSAPSGNENILERDPVDSLLSALDDSVYAGAYYDNSGTLIIQSTNKANTLLDAPVLQAR